MNLAFDGSLTTYAMLVNERVSLLEAPSIPPYGLGTTGGVNDEGLESLEFTLGHRG